uniref:Curli assembly protein CsgC n=1 Tax=Taenia asiatica TaxID=60517 RepID=A0A0R3VVY1_TAEAS
LLSFSITSTLCEGQIGVQLLVSTDGSCFSVDLLLKPEDLL